MAREAGCKIAKELTVWSQEEHSIIDDLRRSHRLLNDCRAFDYTSANELEEIHRSLLEVLEPPSS